MEIRPIESGPQPSSVPLDTGSDAAPSPAAGRGAFANIPDWIRYPWLGVALVLLLLHLYEAPARFPLAPTIDAVTLALFILAVAALCINFVSEVGFPGGARLAFRYEQARAAAADTQESTDAVREALREYSNTMQSWTNSLLLLDEILDEYGDTDAERDKIVARFCIERLEEARDLIQEEGDRIRVSIWWNFPELGGLALLRSVGIDEDAEISNHIFAPGDGLCGQCFIEDRAYNLEDAQDSAYYEKIGDPSEYHGMLLVTLKRGTGRVRGVLSFDRIAKERFSEDAQNAAEALGDLVVYALTHPALDGLFLDDDEVTAAA